MEGRAAVIAPAQRLTSAAWLALVVVGLGLLTAFVIAFALVVAFVLAGSAVS